MLGIHLQDSLEGDFRFDLVSQSVVAKPEAEPDGWRGARVEGDNLLQVLERLTIVGLPKVDHGLQNQQERCWELRIF